MRTVLLHGQKAAGRVARVDDADYDLVRQYRWNVMEKVRPRAPVGPYAYAHVRRDGKRGVVFMHALLTGWPRTDHRDGDGLNNQRSNLRPATASQNGANRRTTLRSESQYKGVRHSPRSRTWEARIRFRGNLRSLGCFADEVAAAKAYDAAARELFGEYARPNFPA